MKIKQILTIIRNPNEYLRDKELTKANVRSWEIVDDKVIYGVTLKSKEYSSMIAFEGLGNEVPFFLKAPVNVPLKFLSKGLISSPPLRSYLL